MCFTWKWFLHCPHIFLAIPDESTKGIASLVAKQRRSHKVRNSMPKGRPSMCSGRVPYRGRVPPILPAVVKSELKDLLALSPVLLSDFEKAFARRFGRSFQYMQYGFLSMFEVLNAASDVISVEQTRAGSLLTLKKSVSEDKQRGWPAGKLVSIHNCVAPTNSWKCACLNKTLHVSLVGTSQKAPSTPRWTASGSWWLQRERSVFSRDEPCDEFSSPRRSCFPSPARFP